MSVVLVAKEDVFSEAIVAICDDEKSVCLAQKRHTYMFPHQAPEWAIGIAAHDIKKGSMVEYNELNDTKDILLSKYIKPVLR